MDKNQEKQWDRTHTDNRDKSAKDAEIVPSLHTLENVTKDEFEYPPTMISTKDLIQLVKKQRPLWDRTHTDYKDRTAKDACWKQVYREIEPSYDFLKAANKHELGHQITKKWYNVRDSYVKSRKHVHHRRSKPYLHSKSLTFLDAIYFSAEETENTIYDNENTREEEQENDNVSEPYINEIYLDVDDMESDSKKPKLDTSLDNTKTEADDNIVAILASLIQKEEDEDRAFFKSITPSVKALSDSSKFEFRIQVMKLIRSLKRKEKKIIKSERVDTDTDSQ